MHVGAACRRRCRLHAVARLLLDLRDLLALRAGRCDLRPEDDVADLALSQSLDVHVVLARVVRHDEVPQRHLHACKSHVHM